MASSSNRKSDSAGRSTSRKRVHVGTGTASRKASAHPKVHIEGHKGETTPKRNSNPRVQRSSSRSQAPARNTRAISPQQAERLRKRAEQRRRLLLRAILAVGAVAATAAAWYALVQSQAFEIRTIDVRGIEQLSEAEVLDAADIPADATLLRFDEAAVRERIGRSPWGAELGMSRRFPATLRIEIVERVPAALVDTGMTFWFVDSDARVITEAVPETSTVLPAIRDLPDFTAEPGARTGSETLKNALSVLGGIDAALASTVRVVTAPSVNETTLLTADGVEIMIGEATRLDEKSIVIADI
ncbi:FtsQ-type POTRA domain-containing protein, partial [bacterium]|nr:FtsQ-type POTRA domain-containing protein [bacterium]